MFLGNDDLLTFNDSQKWDIQPKQKKKRYKPLLHKLDFTGEEVGISKNFKIEIPIPYSKHSISQSDIDAVADCLQ